MVYLYPLVFIYSLVNITVTLFVNRKTEKSYTQSSYILGKTSRPKKLFNSGIARMWGRREGVYPCPNFLDTFFDRLIVPKKVIFYPKLTIFVGFSVFFVIIIIKITKILIKIIMATIIIIISMHQQHQHINSISASAASAFQQHQLERIYAPIHQFRSNHYHTTRHAPCTLIEQN